MTTTLSVSLSLIPSFVLPTFFIASLSLSLSLSLTHSFICPSNFLYRISLSLSLTLIPSFVLPSLSLSLLGVHRLSGGKQCCNRIELTSLSSPFTLAQRWDSPFPALGTDKLQKLSTYRPKLNVSIDITYLGPWWWSACSPSTQTIRVRILLLGFSFFCKKFVFEKNKKTKKRPGVVCNKTY